VRTLLLARGRRRREFVVGEDHEGLALAAGFADAVDARVAAVEAVDDGVHRLACVLGEEADGSPAARELGEVGLDDVDLELDVDVGVRGAVRGAYCRGRGAELLDLCVGEEAGRADEGEELGEGRPDRFDFIAERLGVATVYLPSCACVELGRRAA